MGKLYRRTLKKTLYILGISLIGLVILLTVFMFNYNNNLKEASRKSLLQQEEFIAMLPKNSAEVEETLEEASADLNKGIEEVVEEIKEAETPANNNNVVETANENTNEDIIEEPVRKELAFQYPVDGEIVRDFARDSLIYSETLKEWTVHNGIDIMAERTTVVKAAEDGKVVAIKNDPRYGLTVIIEHQDGYKTLYSNLLTSEFVKEGEELEKGQSIGTVGNSASFEIADEPHLHFEMMLNNEYIDPKIYLK